MDDYDWNSWDSQAAEYLGSDAYESHETLDMSQFQGGQSYSPNSAMSNLGYVDQSSPEMSQADPDMWNSFSNNYLPSSNNQQMDFGQSLDPQGAITKLLGQSTPSYGMSTPSMQLPMNQPNSFNFDSNGVKQTLASIFNNKGFVTGLGALAEGYQNKKKAAALQQMVSQNRQPLDPFGSQRPFYQQQLQQAVQDPYSAPIVSAQVEQLKRAQDIKNAAAGRRSNSATTDPALMAAMAGVAQNYMNSLQTPAGANISPQGLSSLVSAQQQGINNDVNGYLSPALSAMGRSAGMDQNTKTLEALRELLTGGK